jgi:hypothetical protein
MEMDFSPCENICFKYYYLSLHELAFTIRCNIVPISKILTLNCHVIPPLVERGLYCNHLVRLSVRSHFRNRYLSFYWKK